MSRYGLCILSLLVACGGEPTTPSNYEDSFQPDSKEVDMHVDKRVIQDDAGVSHDSESHDSYLDPDSGIQNDDLGNTEDSSIVDPDSGNAADLGTEPDTTVSYPDASQPDSSVPEPDSSLPDPDSFVPEPDAAEPDSSMEPDSSLEPDAGDDPDAGYTPLGTWVHIPGGVYDHQGEPTRVLPLEVTTTEVTVFEFSRVAYINPRFDRYECPMEVCPAERVSWHMAVNYCNQLSIRSGLDQCYSCRGQYEGIVCEEARGHEGQVEYCEGYRLPLRKEREYLYRAGTTTLFYNGDLLQSSGIDANANEIAWYNHNSDGYTQPVAQLTPNDWGLYDMAGNVSEWTHEGMLCGGDWGDYPGSLTAISCGYPHSGPDWILSLNGLRCVRTDF